MTIEATDNDGKEPKTMVQKIEINVIEQKFLGVRLPNSTDINVTSGEPPTIVKSLVNHGGLSSIIFN